MECSLLLCLTHQPESQRMYQASWPLVHLHGHRSPGELQSLGQWASCFPPSRGPGETKPFIRLFAYPSIHLASIYWEPSVSLHVVKSSPSPLGVCDLTGETNTQTSPHCQERAIAGVWEQERVGWFCQALQLGWARALHLRNTFYPKERKIYWITHPLVPARKTHSLCLVPTCLWAKSMVTSLHLNLHLKE